MLLDETIWVMIAGWLIGTVLGTLAVFVITDYLDDRDERRSEARFDRLMARFDAEFADPDTCHCGLRPASV